MTANKKPRPTLVTGSVLPDFQSEIVPGYDEKTFSMSQFSQLQSKADPVYSPPLNVNGLSWRLKVRNNCRCSAAAAHFSSTEEQIKINKQMIVTSHNV